jgi:hypothetical protein
MNTLIDRLLDWSEKGAWQDCVVSVLLPVGAGVVAAIILYTIIWAFYNM